MSAKKGKKVAAIDRLGRRLDVARNCAHAIVLQSKTLAMAKPLQIAEFKDGPSVLLTSEEAYALREMCDWLHNEARDMMKQFEDAAWLSSIAYMCKTCDARRAEEFGEEYKPYDSTKSVPWSEKHDGSDDDEGEVLQ